jgi:hypothetical protein
MDREDKMSSLKTYNREDCSSGFQPGEEWEGNPGGKAVRAQNEHAQDNPGGKTHGAKMTPVRDKGSKCGGRPKWPPTRITNHSIGKGRVSSRG